ncbi:cytochrome b/b6 domain-containing protein [Bordetella sp. FB-8]|uniref:cytochrome b/b6 domain-containing protein n=1 Tax=Bordetella sp. FB-8 TaxID=1159870 RepID=UPI0003749CC2|nr:cytochrome b/b6 domain-containing protein [Bordetella sp. FB-8]
MPNVRIWDLPTRVFHWCFAACIVGAYVSAKLGGLYMDWHVRFGLTALGLVIFRVIWGFIGPRHARFGGFVKGPGQIWAYLRDMAAGTAKSAGHNPLGALSVMAMLVDVGVQAVLGLFSSDDIMVQGPLYNTVSESTADFLTSLHRANQWIILALVILHLLAVAWHTLVRKEPLVRAMIAGDKPVDHLPAGTPPSADGAGVRLRALALAVGVAAFVLWIRSLGS